MAISGCSGSSLGSDEAPLASGAIAPKQVGWIEPGQLAGIDQEVDVKLDTGAKTTSINAEILEQPENPEDAGGMITFRFEDQSGQSRVYERPVLEWVRIKDGDGGFFRRPVVTMQLCIAGRWIEEEVNLADRSQFNYSVLVGRNALEAGNLIVDSAETKTTEANCPARSEAAS
ncbi:MAG: RimK/LysX family protein [Cyanobacteria bacterium P01_D01_bin.128]